MAESTLQELQHSSASSMPIPTQRFGAGPPMEIEEESSFSVWSLQEILLRRRLAFGVTAGIVMIAGIVLLFKDPPLYLSNAQVKVEEKKQVFTLQEFMDFENINYEFYKTQVEMLKSRELCKSVIDILNLDKIEEFRSAEAFPFFYLFAQNQQGEDEGLVSEAILSVTSALNELLQKPVLPPYDPERSPEWTRMIDRYAHRLSVESNRKTPQLIQIYFKSENPAIAAMVANVHAKAYIERSAWSNSAYTQDYINSLETQMAETNREIQQSTNNIMKYKTEHGFFLIGDTEGVREYQDIDDRLSRLRDKLSIAADERRQAEAAYAALYQPGGAGDPDALRIDALDSPLLQTLITRRSAAEQEFIEMQSRYLESHPKYIAAKEKLDALDTEIAREQIAIVDRHEADLQKTRQREADLIDQENQLIEEKRRRDAELQTLKVMQRSHDTLLTQFERLSEDLQNAKASVETRKSTGERTFEIVEYAEVPLRPVNRDILRSMLLSLIAAVGTGFCAVLFLEYQDPTLRTAGDIERTLGITLLGTIPDYPEPPERIALRRPEDGQLSVPSPEAFVALRTAIVFSTLKAQGQVLLVSSAESREGKTSIAANLAFALARSGRKTVLVDADLRNPMMHELCGEYREPGLVDLLLDTVDLFEVAHETEIPNAFLITAGAEVDRPADLLGSDASRKALQQLQNTFEFVVIDSPPILSVPDATILSTFCDRTLLVVRYGRTTKDQATACVDRIQTAGGNISGVVFNRVPRSEISTQTHYYG